MRSDYFENKTERCNQGVGLEIITKVLLLSIDYDCGSKVITYLFSVDGAERSFSGKMHDRPVIRGIAYDEDLDQFVMSLMPLDHKFSSKLFKISWAYVDGKPVNFPVAIIVE